MHCGESKESNYKMKYDFKTIEKKWQDRWEKEPSFKAVDFHPTKPKYYILYEFYNVSGNLHMGHLKGTIPADALARYKRFKGHNVLFPIGGDAFGLPAENAAIKNNINPFVFVKENMENILNQSKVLGLSFDWSRTICTSDPEYYKWTQWIFMQLLKEGKAYKKKGVVNFCEHCKTVLSNEDSQDGKCDRCGGEVVQKERLVWFLSMKEYADKLLDNVDKVQMRESLKESQRNWIGKSEGIQVAFGLVDDGSNKLGEVEIFTTCIETIYGVTFLVLAPENQLVNQLKDKIQNLSEVEAYQQKTSLRSEFDRLSDQKEKSGCILQGVFAVNPINNTKVPVYISDFVLANYGSGAVMAVPSHDQRDYDFAKQYNIPMVQVIEGECSACAVEKSAYISGNSKMINSDEFNGMPVQEAKQKIADKVVQMKVGSKTINYKMQDWPFNRQRYWGEPFPVVFCDRCGIVPLKESDLPLTLPQTNDYIPNEQGDSPLAKVESWVKCECPKCGEQARRETDTMPNWAGSSWYWLRYIDPHNSDKLADMEKLKYWGKVDCYTGGTEHITRHVLYAFFWQNFLYEIGAVPSREPFVWKMGSGLVLDDQGKKMSKSSANGVSPMEVIQKYGSDTARLHLHFLGGYEDDVMWTFEGISGVTSFLNRVWKLPEMIKGEEVSTQHIYKLNKLIKMISEDIENLRMNTAIAACMSFIKEVRKDGFITKEELKQFLILLNPLAPHITSEVFEKVFGSSILEEKWPEYNPKYLIEDVINLPIQINGKMSRVISVDRDIPQKELLSLIKETFPNLALEDSTIKKVVYIPNKIINIIR